MSAATAGTVFRITRWPSERPLRVLVALVAIAIWILLAFTIVGIVYAALFGLFFLVAQSGRKVATREGAERNE